MKKWLSGLAPRERRFLGWGAAVLFGLLLYLMVLEPLAENIVQAEAQVQTRQQQLASLQVMIEEYQRLGKGRAGKRKVQGKGSLLSVVDRTSSRLGLKPSIKRLSPEGKTKVRISMEDANFDKLVAWLAELARNHGISTESINLRRADTIGTASGNLVLMTPPNFLTNRR